MGDDFVGSADVDYTSEEMTRSKTCYVIINLLRILDYTSEEMTRSKTPRTVAAVAMMGLHLGRIDEV